MSEEHVNKILNFFNSKAVESGLTLLAAGAAITDPVKSLLLTAFKEAASAADEAKLKQIIKGLASGLNQETFVNELKTYIKSSDEHAANVANTVRNAAIANSPNACAVLGRILADHVSDSTDYDRDDVIIIHALSTVTDDDLSVFQDMMRSADDGYIRRTQENTYCADWCTANRICKARGPVLENEGIIFSDDVIPNSAAFKLIKYMDEVRQLFRKFIL